MVRLVIFLFFVISIADLASFGQAPVPVMRWGELPSLPNEHGLAGMFAEANEQGLWAAGGANFPQGKPWEGGVKQWSHQIYHLPNDSSDWQLAGRLREPRGYGLTVSIRGMIVAIGGSDATHHFKSCEVIADGAHRFAAGLRKGERRLEWPDLPAPRANCAGLVLGSKIFVLGGIETPMSTECATEFYCLDVDALSSGWQKLEPIPGPARMFAGMGTDGEQLFVMGGASLTADAEGKPKRTYLSDVWCYREGSGWKPRQPMPTPRVAMPSPLPYSQQQLLVFSGDDGAQVNFQPLSQHPGFPRDALWYDTRHDRWTKLLISEDDWRWSRATAPWVMWNKRWYVISGESRPGVRTPQNLSLELFPPGS